MVKDLEHRMRESSTTATPKQRGRLSTFAWYSNGVMPILVRDLAKYKDAKHIYVMLEIIAKHHIPSEIVGNQKLLYLTTENLAKFFRSIYADKRISEEIIHGKFNETAKKPFRIYNVNALVQEPETYKSVVDVKRVLEGGRVDIISTTPGGDMYFIITEANSHMFIPRYFNVSREDRVESIERFNFRLRNHYKKFKVGVFD